MSDLQHENPKTESPPSDGQGNSRQTIQTATPRGYESDRLPGHAGNDSAQRREVVDGRRAALYPPRAKAKSGGRVTAIAGFRCASGVVLCADSELNYGTVVKTHINKITIFGNTAENIRGAVTGAGDWDDVQRVVEYLQSRWPEIAGGKISFEAVAEEKIKEIHGQTQTSDW